MDTITHLEITKEGNLEITAEVDYVRVEAGHAGIDIETKGMARLVLDKEQARKLRPALRRLLGMELCQCGGHDCKRITRRSKRRKA